MPCVKRSIYNDICVLKQTKNSFSEASHDVVTL